MKLSNSIKICGYFLVSINLIISFSTIWLFLRIVPAIDSIVQNNVSSLEAAESMLTSLIVIENEGATKKDLQAFKVALKSAMQNVSKNDEKIAIGIIERSYKQAFNNDVTSRKELRFAIDYLFQINKDEILRLKNEAAKASKAGAWGLAFMALIAFFLTLLLLKRLDKKLLVPVKELYEVIRSYKKRNKFRRCMGENVNSDIKLIFDGVNELLDDRIEYDK